MHEQSLVHGLVSSHAIQLVTANFAKLGNFEYTVDRSVAVFVFSSAAYLHRPSHQAGAHGRRAPAKIVRAPAKIVRVPAKIVRVPAKITGLFMLKNRERPNGNPVLSVFHGGWSRRLSHTHSYPGCHAPDRLVVALADHGCSQYRPTSIAAYDYS